MAELLYRLGRLAARRAWTVIVTWIVILGLSITAFLVAGGALSSAITVPGTDTSKVADLLKEKFPSAGGGSGTMVFHTTDESPFTIEQRTEIGQLLVGTSEIDGVGGTSNPFTTQSTLATQTQQLADGRSSIADARTQLDQAQQQLDQADQQLADIQARQQALSESRSALTEKSTTLDLSAQLLDMATEIRAVSHDEDTAIASVSFIDEQLSIAPETLTAVVAQIEDNVPAGVEVQFSSELTKSTPEILGVGELVGVILAALTLLVMLGSVVAAAIPILSALVGVGVGITASLALSGVVVMPTITPILGVMLGLAVGIDYSLFILNRHRRQLLRGVEVHESIGLANGTSGNAVVFAGATVLVALLALNLTGISFLGMMGTVGAVCVAVAIAIAITLTPAILALLGPRILKRTDRARIGQPRSASSPVKPMGTGRAIVTVIASLAVLSVVALPALSMRLGLPDGSSEAVDSTQYKAYKLTEEKFGAGFNGPLLVIAELPEAVSSDELLAEQVEIGSQLLEQNDVAAVAPIGASKDSTVLAFQVIPAEGPTSASTEQLVRDLRDLSPLTSGAKLGVAGSASGNIDISEKLAQSLPGYLAVVLGLSLVIMIFVFRSILIPITATLGFILSLFATFGGLTAIFQWGWLGAAFGVHDPGPVLSFLPTILIGILFGLAMDYQLFLVTGMREARAHGAPARLAVQRGVRAGRTVVIAAAIIMISVFAGFIFSNSAMIRSVGFGLAFGVLVDAFVVRLLLIPAVMHLLGESAWWLPRWLDRIVPNVDVEGASLERTHPVRVTTPADALSESRRRSTSRSR